MSMKTIIGAPHSVALDITNKCNLRCLHCFNNSGENDVMTNELTDSEVLDFIDSICQMRPFSFCFCGGETLLRKNLVIESLQRLARADVKCNLVSNGLLASSATLHALERAGLNGIQFRRLREFLWIGVTPPAPAATA
ncbi:MAG: radical SAM protein [Collinsella stercoris]|nr:radical SAM protein [Collinsella stercoris]